MADKGFAIRCPNCLRWNVWQNLHPEEVTVESAEEFKEILKGLALASSKGKPDIFYHSKVLCCQSPRRLCPASFEAFVCRKEQNIFEFLKEVEAWSIKRDFRLYKANCLDRWEGEYYGILFCARPVVRERKIELEYLMDRELLSRMIVGVSHEIQAPLTVYGAKLFKPRGGNPEVYWMPIEAYSMERTLVPPRYNKFCHTCREIVIRELINEFKRAKYNVNNCPIGFGQNGKCAEREAVCMEVPKDWNHCPAFIEKRNKMDARSNSDRELIMKVEKAWRCEQSMADGVWHRSWSGFREVAFPIVVHDQLVGVAMTGQVFFEPEEITNIHDFINGKCNWNVGGKPWALLRGQMELLEKAKQELINEEKKLEEQKKSRFFISKSKFYARIELLYSNIDRFTAMANSQYREIRGRSEAAFRQEILGFVRSHKSEDDFFDRRVLHVLKRMREFWAFEGVYLAKYSFETKMVSVIAFCTRCKEESFGIPGRKIGKTDVGHWQSHPYPFLFRSDADDKIGLLVNPSLKDLLPIYKKAVVDAELDLPETGCYFCVAVPFSEEVYTFVFAVRDEAPASYSRPLDPAGISTLCQNAIFRACSEVVYAFGDVWYRKASEQAWLDFSALATHRIGNEVDAIGRILRAQISDQVIRPDWPVVWRKDHEVMVGCIERTKKMLGELACLTGDVKPKPERVDLSNLLKRSVRGVLMSEGNMVVDVKTGAERVYVDPDLMEQVFRELAANAFREKGEDTIIEVKARREDSFVCISFWDNGPGIPDNRREEVFTSRITLRRGGHGFGLPTVRQIIEAHRGSIRIEPSKRGANFVLLLPLGGI